METKTEKKRISMSELRKYLSPEEISELESNGNADDDGYNVSVTSGAIQGKPGDYFGRRK